MTARTHLHIHYACTEMVIQPMTEMQSFERHITFFPLDFSLSIRDTVQANFTISFKMSKLTFLVYDFSSNISIVQLSCCSLRAEGVNDGMSDKEQVFAK